jgi:hypothetical protein
MVNEVSEVGAQWSSGCAKLDCPSKFGLQEHASRMGLEKVIAKREINEINFTPNIGGTLRELNPSYCHVQCQRTSPHLRSPGSATMRVLSQLPNQILLTTFRDTEFDELTTKDGNTVLTIIPSLYIRQHHGRIGFETVHTA